MIQDLKPYPKYKESGIPWLGEIPEHWEVRRGKVIFRCINERSSTGNEELLTVSSERGVVPRRTATVNMFKAESYVGYKLCWPGDLVINSLWAWARGLGVSQYHGIVSSAYGIYRLRPMFNGSSDYIHELVRSAPFLWELRVRSKGVWISRLELTDDSFLGVSFPLPSSNEQSAIVRFLDHTDRRIKRYILAKQKLIKLLNEQKQVVIHQAVTRGLDPNVRLKPSGVEWLGNVPEHWRIIKIKRIARINPSRSEAYRKHDSNELVVFLPMERVTTQGEIDSSQLRPIHEVRQGFTYFRRGDVVIAKITPCFENGKGACLNNLPTEIGFGTTEFIVLRPGVEVTSEFLYQLTVLAQFRRLGVESMTGSAGQQRVSQDFVSNFTVALPPLEEQNEIVHYIKNKNVKFDFSIGHAKREINLLREYRDCLIADLVTGKLDVREVAMRLPEDLEEIEPIEESGILTEEVENPEDTDLDEDGDEGEA